MPEVIYRGTVLTTVNCQAILGHTFLVVKPFPNGTQRVELHCQDKEDQAVITHLFHQSINLSINQPNQSLYQLINLCKISFFFMKLNQLNQPYFNARCVFAH